VFLDTSIHMASLKGTREAAKVASTLRQFKWKGTSSYAKVEYGNNILSAVTYFRNKLKELGSFEALRSYVYNRLPALNRHQIKFKNWFSNLLSKCHEQDDKEATERAGLALASMWINGTGAVADSCDEVRDGTRCIWADQNSSNGEAWRRPSRCNRRGPRCRLPEFFVEKLARFHAIRGVIRELSPERRTQELSNFADTIDAATGNPEILRDYSECRKLADAIIAVDSDGYLSFFTQNIRESDVLCGVMGQILLYLHQDPSDEVERRDYRK
jgi:hypothetical protein